MSALALLVTAATTSWVVLGALATLFVTRGRALAGAPAPVTVLKPLAGADPGLRENLITFFEQDHPDFELLFGVERAEDPAIPIVRALMREHPGVRARLVVHAALHRPASVRAPSACNPKVKNLRGILPHASHDLVLVSDSNVRAPRGYLREAALSHASRPDVGLVTHVFVGSPAAPSPSLAAALECVQLTGFCASGAALPTAFGEAAVIGKSMLFSRAFFASIGGFARVADVLAEDYVIGKMVQRAGRRVVVGSTVLENVVGAASFSAFFARQLRWSMLRARLAPAAFALEPLVTPLVVLPVAWALLGAAALAWLVALYAVRDALPWLALKGPRGLSAALALSLPRDVCAMVVWATTPFQRHISWRGRRVRLGPGTVLLADSC